tara:strand:+ start:542 stop:1390 length:849 start_codon:yes stop_codon:yes gene_type:complete
MGKNISVYGSTGFIGGRFCQLYHDDIVRIPREQRSPETNEILYFISTTNNYNIFENPHVDIETNLSLLIDVLEKCKGREDVVFNFISSWFVYGKTDDLPAHENSVCNPRGFYSITKRTAEQLLTSYCETFKIKYRILRLGNVFGETDADVSKKKNAMQYLINEIYNDRDINLYDDGSNVRDYIYVDEVCRAIKLCIDSAPCNETINIGSGNPRTIREIMSYCRDKLNSKSKFVSIDAPEFHKIVQVKNMYLDITKLKNLGYVPDLNIWDKIDVIMNNLGAEL